MRAYILIQTGAHGKPLAGRLTAIPGVVEAHDVSGPYDVIALAAARSARQLRDEIVADIERIPGVTRAIPATVLGSLSEVNVAATPGLHPTSGRAA